MMEAAIACNFLAISTTSILIEKVFSGSRDLIVHKRCSFTEKTIRVCIIRKRACSCDKTIKPSKSNRTDKVKVAYPRISSPDLPSEPLKFIQENITRFGYSLDITTKFNFTFCCACNSSFQRKKKCKTNSKFSALRESQSLEVNLNDNDLDNDNTNKIDEAEQVIAFNLVIKPFSGSVLPSKWVEIKASSLDDILAEVHYYIGKLIDSKEIVYSDYSVTFKRTLEYTIKNHVVHF
ncbi:hypothetical protein RhiirA4_485233 [Rhizophagus irregularis]|uniref:HAT C-terminal dimerisation domain-containing protein n=1 Tax=Rhizophagus irregularis TaxID=588596 RepID=A0A2I1HPV8_9GLOM|nr:hypothetical protein RhiirA4_485233 [Rhizophagus irregularis]